MDYATDAGPRLPNADLKLTSRSSNNPTAAHEKLRRYLTSGHVPMGAKLNQRRLCDALEIGKTPLLKALHKLETEGLVDYVRNKGFYVHKLTLREAYEIFELREGLETALIGNIVGKLTSDDIRHLEGIFDKFTEEDREIDRSSYWDADVEFHTYLVHLCQNRLMQRILLNYQIYERAFTAGLIRPANETIGEHLAIIRALKDENKELAVGLSTKHVSRAKALLANLLEEMSRIGLSPDEIYLSELDNVKKMGGRSG